MPRLPVRAQCLAVSLRYWDIGQHGVRAVWSQPGNQQSFLAQEPGHAAPGATCTA